MIKYLQLLIWLVLIGSFGFWADYKYTEWKINKVQEQQNDER